jgi:general secretion pathway protein A
MYTAFYGLREKPFMLSPNPRYLYLSESHREALAHLLYGIEQGEGFIAITGEVGTGKTTLCRTLLERMGPATDVAFLFNPSRSGMELLQTIAQEFDLPVDDLTRRELHDQLNRFLLARKGEGRRVLLIVDEAQNLSHGTLEQIRLLSNLETSSEKLIQILLLGQPELDTKLDSHRLRQLRQRISVRWMLKPLSPKDTRRYVLHRLQVAAGMSRDVFSQSALRLVHRYTRGTPRLINVLCDRALLLGFAEGEPGISARTVREAAREIPDARRSFLLRRPWRWLAAAAALVGVVAGVYGWRWHSGDSLWRAVEIESRAPAPAAGTSHANDVRAVRTAGRDS